VPDELATEEPLEIRVDTRPLVVTMRTPGHDDELAAGYLFTEAAIRTRADVFKMARSVRNDDGNVLEVFLAAGLKLNRAALPRHFSTSSCGICGKTSITEVHRHFPKLPARLPFRVPARLLEGLPAALGQSQSIFARTGGLHAAAVFNREGKLLVLREDIGRHNAVDKVLGYGLLNGLLPFDQHILLVSGRASFEIVQKALAGRIPVVAAVSAPSSLAVQFAIQSRQTLIGFLREGRMNVYARPERVQFAGFARRT